MSLKSAAPQRLLGFDFGTRRIGVASGQCITRSASAVTTLTSRDGQPDWTAIGTLIAEWQPDALVVGIPYHMDGGNQAMSDAAERFCRQLEGRFQLPVFRAEERLSSVAAEQKIRDKQSDSDRVDAVAAQIILQSWLHQKADDT